MQNSFLSTRLTSPWVSSWLRSQRLGTVLCFMALEWGGLKVSWEEQVIYLEMTSCNQAGCALSLVVSFLLSEHFAKRVYIFSTCRCKLFN